MKYSPKSFWGMFHKAPASDAALDVDAFVEFNQQLFYDPAIPGDTFTHPSDI